MDSAVSSFRKPAIEGGSFSEGPDTSIFGSVGPSRSRGDRAPVRLVGRQAAAPELSTPTPLLGQRFEMQTREEPAEGKKRGRSILSMTSAVFL